MPKDVVNEALDKKMLHFVQDLSISHVLGEISEELERDTTIPLRICVPALGSAAWGDLTPQVGYMMDVTKETVPTNGRTNRRSSISCTHSGLYCINTHMGVRR